MKKPLRRQRPIKGGRIPRGAGLEQQLDAVLRREAARFGVSVPFVITVALADYFSIQLDSLDQL
jgi:hypothetical protein